jgi:accessory gene regulator B
MIDYLKEKGLASEKEAPVVLYGMKLLFMTLVELISVILLAVWYENLLEVFCFLLGFCPLRLYAGGYHAKTPIRCFFMTLAVYMVFSFLLGIIPVERYRFIELITGILTFFAVQRLAPIIHENRIIDSYEIEKYRRLSIQICSGDLVLIMISEMVLPANPYTFSFSLGLAMVVFFIMVVLSKDAYCKRRSKL